MSTTLTRRVYLAVPAASHLLFRQIALSAPAADLLAKPQVAGQLAPPPVTLSCADRRALLMLGVLGEIVAYLFGVDLLMIALL